MLLDRAAPILSKTKVISPQVFEDHTVFSFESLAWLFHPIFQSHRICCSLNLAISALKIKFEFMRPSDGAHSTTESFVCVC